MENNNRVSENFDVAIIGAGASGLAAVLTLKKENPQASVAVFEKKDKAAKKLAVTGNGRCNISNLLCRDREIVSDFFDEIGIVPRTDFDGKQYPYNEDAAATAELLICESMAVGAKILLNHDVKKVEADSEEGFEDGFFLFVEEKIKAKEKLRETKGKKGVKGGTSGTDCEEKVIEKVFRAKKLLIATGGKSYPTLGTTGDGYVLARSLGHSVSPLAPGLTAVCVKAPIGTADELKMLKGVRAKGSAKLFFEGRELMSESGEIQFREDSISGICIMNLSNHIKPQIKENDSARRLSFEGYEIKLDLADEIELETLKTHMRRLCEKDEFTVCDVLKSLLKRKLAEEVLNRMGTDINLHAKELSDEDINVIAREIKAFSFEVTGLVGWKEAQVTCGGVSENEINPNTMESELVKGLYFSGEVTEYAGSCGGFNLHHAWLTGIRAGKAIADSLR